MLPAVAAARHTGGVAARCTQHTTAQRGTPRRSNPSYRVCNLRAVGSREYMDDAAARLSAVPRFGDQDLVVAALSDLRDVRFGTRAVSGTMPCVCFLRFWPYL
jgi:hypothetical protein